MMHKLLAEGLARSMYAYCSIARGNSGFLGEGVERSLSEIDFAERFAIGGLNLIESSGDAAAQVSRSQIGSRRRRLYLWCQGFEGTRFDCAVTVVIDHCIAENAEEPGVGGLPGLQILSLRDGSGVSALKDVFSGCAVTDSSLDKGEEALSLASQIGDG